MGSRWITLLLFWISNEETFSHSMFTRMRFAVIYVCKMWIYMTFTFSVVKSLYFLKSVVSTPFFDDRLQTAKPTTGCHAHLPLDVKIVLHIIQNHYYDKNHDDTLYSNMRAAWFIIERTLFQKRVCESLDEFYLYSSNKHLVSLHLLYSHYDSVILICTLYL